MEWLKNFMIGRYGTDQLSLVMIVIGLILIIINRFLSSFAIILIGYLILGLSLYRVLSRNITKRQQENFKFLEISKPIMPWIQSRIMMIKSSKEFKYVKCPKCKQIIRVPRGKGTIAIKCQRCDTRFIEKV